MQRTPAVGGVARRTMRGAEVEEEPMGAAAGVGASGTLALPRSARVARRGAGFAAGAAGNGVAVAEAGAAAEIEVKWLDAGVSKSAERVRRRRGFIAEAKEGQGSERFGV
ncbi:hypothetical protein ACQJBY_071862 [Aegilops geniculata]